MKINQADLHIHTTASDGIYSAVEIVDMTAKNGLTHISITDHDSVDAYSDELFTYSKIKGIELITGVEFGCRKKSRDIHILGHFIDVKNEILLTTLAALRSKRIIRCQNFLDKLKDIQMDITFEEVANMTDGSIGRVHIARKMIEKGYVSTIKEAFELYLSDGCECYIEKNGISVDNVIQLIKACGGISVLAHPKLIENEEIVNEVIEAGIQGLEVYHKNHNSADEIHYKELAEMKGLIITGGSDFHGRHSNESFKKLELSDEFVKRIKTK